MSDGKSLLLMLVPMSAALQHRRRHNADQSRVATSASFDVQRHQICCSSCFIEASALPTLCCMGAADVAMLCCVFYAVMQLMAVCDAVKSYSN